MTVSLSSCRTVRFGRDPTSSSNELRPYSILGLKRHGPAQLEGASGHSTECRRGRASAAGHDIPPLPRLDLRSAESPIRRADLRAGSVGCAHATDTSTIDSLRSRTAATLTKQQQQCETVPKTSRRLSAADHAYLIASPHTSCGTPQSVGGSVKRFGTKIRSSRVKSNRPAATNYRLAKSPVHKSVHSIRCSWRGPDSPSSCLHTEPRTPPCWYRRIRRTHLYRSKTRYSCRYPKTLPVLSRHYQATYSARFP